MFSLGRYYLHLALEKKSLQSAPLFYAFFQVTFTLRLCVTRLLTAHEHPRWRRHDGRGRERGLTAREELREFLDYACIGWGFWSIAHHGCAWSILDAHRRPVERFHAGVAEDVHHAGRDEDNWI